MDPSITTNSLDKKEFHVTSFDKSHINPDGDVRLTLISSKDSNNIPTIILDPSSNNDDLTVTPAFPNFPTDEEVVIKPNSIILLEPSNDDLEPNIDSNSLPTSNSQQSSEKHQLINELKYLLRPTNSLANVEATVQESQEADSAIKHRTSSMLDENTIANIDGLTPQEIKSLDAAERRSIAARGKRMSQASNRMPQGSNRPSSRSIQPTLQTRSYSQSPSTIQNRSYSQSPSTILIAQSEHRTFLNRFLGLTWAFFAAYSFSIILFLTKIYGIDLIFSCFLQMIVQTLAFGIYAFYKGYNLLGPTEHRIATIFRGVLLGIGVITSFLAYYYITLPELSAIRQTQVILTIILSVFLLQERVTISRIIACILTLIAIIVLIRPTKFGTSLSTIVNSTDYKPFWNPYSLSLNCIIGISFALCTAITYSIASIMNKIYFTTEHLHNTVLCFWSALSASCISIILICVRYFILKDNRSFPHDWRLFVGVALALASIFVFIANQKAIKRERSSIVTLIYSTDIIHTLILHNLYMFFKSDIIIILGCILILVSVLIICIEVFIIERRKNKLAIKVAQAANATTQNNNIPKPLNSTIARKRLSV